MREIKFRAWEKHAKRMAEITTFKWQSDHLYHQIYTRAIVNEKMIDEWYAYDFGSNSNGIILMQYTGLKDKNGREIYEGDIAKESRKRVKNERHFVVVWNNDIGSYTFKPLDKIETSYPCFNIGTIKNLEVIGNIYENPELLKGSEE